MHRRFMAGAGLAALVVGLGGAGAQVAAGFTVSAGGGGTAIEVVAPGFGTAPPTTAQCEAKSGFACYSPNQLEVAYDMKSLYAEGLTGKGETIALVDSFGSPTIQADLATFDKAYGLPAPPSFTIIAPAGKIPTYTDKNSLMVDWAEETTLDVEYSHAMAPGANLLLVETPVAETIGVTGFPQIVAAENYVVDHHLADVISQSLATAEISFPSARSLLALRSDYTNAAANNVSVLGAAGDWGATSPSNAAESAYYTRQTVNWPASDPLVTAVGGLQLHLNAAGDQVAPPNVWNDTSLLGSPAAGSGGLSDVFPRPSYQNSVASIAGTHRAIPDVSMSAAVDGGVLVYMSFPGIGSPGYYLIGGTSEACPLFAGVVAVADQKAGHDLGALNPALYSLVARRAPGIVGVTTGENTVTFFQAGRNVTVDGWTAQPGYNLASGLGTIDGALFVPELAAWKPPAG